MTVKELILELKKCDLTKEIEISFCHPCDDAAIFTTESHGGLKKEDVVECENCVVLFSGNVDDDD